ncbi:hypothetical protein CYY_000144 [Polysphondylium violaceum]|uniref:Xylose isomerase-like TIM barrel domain-containing protein n=1 Tax=Polysphondylium violaceum TaxID=133409 RepID=A0A8J4Q587_9MYCE|nr:hypothetical protein CYY_000144 [Polysphondylium violaceum]
MFASVSTLKSVLNIKSLSSLRFYSNTIKITNNNSSIISSRITSKRNMSKRKNNDVVEIVDNDDTIDLDDIDEHDCDSHHEDDTEDELSIPTLQKEVESNKKLNSIVNNSTTKVTATAAAKKPAALKQTVISSFFTKVDQPADVHTDKEYLDSRAKKTTTTTPTTTTASTTPPKKKTKKSKEVTILVDYDKNEKYVPELQYSASKKEKMDGIKIGAHMSIKGGIPSLIKSAIDKGFKAIAFFVATPRSWRGPKINAEDAKSFKEECTKHNFSPKYMMPHGSYFLNLGSPEADKLEKSRNLFLAEMKCCEELGITLYNFHPGSHLNMISEEESIKVIAESINYAHKHTSTVTAVIECTAGQGTNLGYKFEHLRDIIALVDDKTRVGVCLDTCHMFAAGYNIDSYLGCQKVFQEFDRIVGFSYLRGIHLNDSKAKCGEKLDRHENIDKGHIGSPCFRYMVNDNRFFHIPMILETEGSHIEEVKQLYSYIKEDNQEK